MSEHARYRGRLSRLAERDMDVTVALVAAERGWVEPGVAAQRTFGRFHPGRSSWATLVYALGRTHVRVDAFDEHDDAAVRCDVTADPAGPLRFARVEEDGVLAGLDATLRAHPTATIIRYRPGRRCVLRVGERFVKLVHPDLGPRLHDAGGMLWRARAAGRLPFRVAEPDHWDVEHGALWQGVVAGEPIATGLATGSRSIARLVGESIGALATAPVDPWQEWSGESQWARTQRAAAQIVHRVPELRNDLDDALTRLRRLHDRFVSRVPVPVHGAASLDQWLDDGSTLGLVDFDRFSWSDPELDAASFLIALDFEGVPRATIEDLEVALRDGIREAGFVPDERRWATYRADTRLRKVARTAMAIRPDGDERAARHLRAVVEALDAADRVD